MIDKLLRYLHQLRALQRVNMSLARGTASRASRTVDPSVPATWEFSGFSQNGEDGIVEILSGRILEPSRYFVEIGAADGLENNTTWLLLTKRWAGLWVEGDARLSKQGFELFQAMNNGVQMVQQFVTRPNLRQILSRSRVEHPDLFSLDIDGNDFYVALDLLRSGMRPAICVVEYNSAHGPDRSVTIPYSEVFRVTPGPGSSLYYGCSLGAWKTLFDSFGYRFVTVDSNGVNAFFVYPDRFEAGFIDSLRGTSFAENTSHAREYGGGWKEQSMLLQGRPLTEVAPQLLAG